MNNSATHETTISRAVYPDEAPPPLKEFSI